MFVCSRFRSLFVDCTKAFVVLTGRKSCCRLGSLFREAKDACGYLTLSLKG
jgi:hypothetical protein